MMTDAEILAELDRIKALPGLTDVARDGGLFYSHLWQIRTGKCSLTRYTASRLESSLMKHRKMIQATFGVSTR